MHPDLPGVCGRHGGHDPKGIHPALGEEEAGTDHKAGQGRNSQSEGEQCLLNANSSLE